MAPWMSIQCLGKEDWQAALEQKLSCSYIQSVSNQMMGKLWYSANNAYIQMIKLRKKQTGSVSVVDYSALY